MILILHLLSQQEHVINHKTMNAIEILIKNDENQTIYCSIVSVIFYEFNYIS